MKHRSLPDLLPIGVVLATILLMFTGISAAAVEPDRGSEVGGIVERLAGLDAAASGELILQLDAAGELAAARDAARLAVLQHAEDLRLHVIHAWLHDEAALLRPAIASYLAVLRLTTGGEAASTPRQSLELRKGASLELPEQADALRPLAEERLLAIRPWLDADQREALDTTLAGLGINPTPALSAVDPQEELIELDEGRTDLFKGQVQALLALAEDQQRSGSHASAQHMLIRALNLTLRSTEQQAHWRLFQVAQQAQRSQLAEPVVGLLLDEAEDEPLRTWLAIRLALLSGQEAAVPPLLADLFARSARPPFGAADYLLALQRDDPAAAAAVLSQLSSSEREAAVVLLLGAQGMAHRGLLRFPETGSQGLLAALLASLDPASFEAGQWAGTVVYGLASTHSGAEEELASEPERLALLRELLRWPLLAEWAFSYLYHAHPSDERVSTWAVQALSNAAHRAWPAFMVSLVVNRDQLLVPPTLYLARQSLERADGDQALAQWRGQLSAAGADRALAQLLALRAVLAADATTFPAAAADLLAQLQVMQRPGLDQAIARVLIERAEALVGAAVLVDVITAPNIAVITAWAGWFEDCGLAAQVPALIDHWLAQQPSVDSAVDSQVPALTQIIGRLLNGQRYEAGLALLAAHPAEMSAQGPTILPMLLRVLLAGHREQARLIMTRLGLIDREVAELQTMVYVNNEPLMMALAKHLGPHSPLRQVMTDVVAEAPDFASGLWRALLDGDAAAREAYVQAHLPALREAPPAVQDLVARLLDGSALHATSEVALWWHSRGILVQQIEALDTNRDQPLDPNAFADLLLSVALHQPSALAQVLLHHDRVSHSSHVHIFLNNRLHSPSHLMAYLRLVRHPDFGDRTTFNPAILRGLLLRQFSGGRDVEALARWHQQATALAITDLAQVEFAPLLVAMAEMLRRDPQLVAWAGALVNDDPWSHAWRSAQRLVAGEAAGKAIALEALHSHDSSLNWRLASAQVLLLAPSEDRAVDDALLALWSAAITHGLEVDAALAAHVAARVAADPSRHHALLQGLVRAQHKEHWPASGWTQVFAVVAALGDRALTESLLTAPTQTQEEVAPLGRDLNTYITLLRAGWGELAATLFQAEWRHLEPQNLRLEGELPADALAAFTAAIADPDLRLLAAALVESRWQQRSPGRSARLTELAQSWAARRASGVVVDPLLRQRFVDNCLVEDVPAIDAALAPCLRVLVSDAHLPDELADGRNIQPRRLAILREELRQGSVDQGQAILAALAAVAAKRSDNDFNFQRTQLSQLHSAVLNALQSNQWPAERLPELRRLIGGMLDQHEPQHSSERLLGALLLRHAATGALRPFSAWCAERRPLLLAIPESQHSQLAQQLLRHRPTEAAAAAAYQAELLELLAEPGLAALVAPLPNLFAQLLQGQLITEAVLLAEGERLASALPRGGWAWHEVARLRAGRADHDGARQAWQQAIAATNDDQLRERWTSESERGAFEDAAGLEQLLNRLSDELRAAFAIEADGATAPAMFAPDLDLLRHRFAQDDVRLAQRRAAGELATLMRYELVGSESRDVVRLLALIHQQEVVDTVLNLLSHNDPMGRLIHARAYELLHPSQRAVPLYQHLAAEHPELPLIRRRLQAAALGAGDEAFLPELIAASDDELNAISAMAARTASFQGQGVAAHHRQMAQTRMWSAVLAARPVTGQRPAPWAERAAVDFLGGSSVSQPSRVYLDDIHPSQREGVEGTRRVHQALFSALQPYPAWSEEAFARRVAAAGADARASQASQWRAVALAALVARAQLSTDQTEQASGSARRNPHAAGSVAVILPPPLSFLLRLSAAEDPQLDDLAATLANTIKKDGAELHPEIQAQLAAYRSLLGARDQEFLAAADALLAISRSEAWRVPAALDDILHFAVERCTPTLIQDWICAQLLNGSLVDGQDLLAIEQWALQLATQPAAVSAFFAAVEAALPAQRRYPYARLLRTLSQHPALLPAIVARLPEMQGAEDILRELGMRIDNLHQRSPEEGMALLAGLHLLGAADAAVPAMGRDLPLLAQTAQVLQKLSGERRAGYRELLATQEGFLAGVWSELLVDGDVPSERWWGRYSEHLPVLQRASRPVQIALVGLLPPPPAPLPAAHSAVHAWAMELGNEHRQRLLNQIAAGEGSAYNWGTQLREQLTAINDPRVAQELLEAALAAAGAAQYPALVRSLSRHWRPSHNDNFSGLAPLLTLVRDPQLAPHVFIFSNTENAFFWAVVQAYRDFSGPRVERLAKIDELLAPQVDHLDSVEALVYPLQFVLDSDQGALNWAAARSGDTALAQAWRLAAGLISGDEASLQRVAAVIADDSLSPHWRIIVARGMRSAHIEALPLATRRRVLPLFDTLVAAETSLQPWTQTIMFRLFPPVAEAPEEWRSLSTSMTRSLARSGRQWSDQVEILAALAIAINHDDLLQALIAQADAGFGQRSEHYAVLIRSGRERHAAQLWLRRWPQLPTDQEGAYDAELAAALPAFLEQVPDALQRSLAALILGSLPGSVDGDDDDPRSRQSAVLAAMDLSALDADQRQALLQATIGRLPPALEGQVLGVLRVQLAEQTLVEAAEVGGESGNQLRAWHYARLRAELAAGDSSALRAILPTLIDPGEGASRRLLNQRSLLVGELIEILAEPAMWPEARLPELRDLVGSLMQLPKDRRRPAPPLLPTLISQHRSAAALSDMLQWLNTLDQERRDHIAGSLSSSVLVPALAQALSAKGDERLPLIDALMTASALAPLLASEQGLFPDLIEAGLLSSEQLRAQAQPWASAAARGGWAWAELANLHHAAGDHAAAAAAWEQAIAHSSGNLSRRFTRDRDRQRPPAASPPRPTSERSPQPSPPQPAPPDIERGANEF